MHGRILIVLVIVMFSVLGCGLFGEDNRDQPETKPMAPSALETSNSAQLSDPLAADCLPGPLDAFAQCVKKSGAVLYGVSWDLRTEAQRLKFNRSVDQLPYVQCNVDKNDPPTIRPECLAKKFSVMPTWVYGNGTRVTGIQELPDVAAATGCKLPSDLGIGYELTAKENLAKCLASAGATVYSTTWCGWCRRQEEAFGASFRHIRHVICDVGAEAAKECSSKKINSYPTWLFPDGTRLEGAGTLTELAASRQCPWPVWPDDTERLHIGSDCIILPVLP